MPRGWLRLPRRTVRLRLTLVYGCLFLLSGAALLAITYLLVSRSLPTGPVTGQAAASPLLTPGGVSSGQVFVQARAGSCGLFTGPLGTPAQVAARARQCLSQQRALELNQLLTESGIALAIMTVVSIGLGWLVAGRVLRKLRTITAAARSISASSLHARLTMAGPDDELKELGDTFDGLLARLEAAFGAQRQFVANASHELRTPLARQRTLIEVALADPEPSVAALQDVCTRVLATGEQQERLIEALLTLARSQRGLDRREPIDLAAIAGEVLEARRPEAELRGLTVVTTLEPAPALGDARLTERLAANLVDNAMRHNVAHGTHRCHHRDPGRPRGAGGAEHRPADPAGSGPPALPAVPAQRRRPHRHQGGAGARAVDRRRHSRGAWRMAAGERADRGRAPGPGGFPPAGAPAAGRGHAGSCRSARLTGTRMSRAALPHWPVWMDRRMPYHAGPAAGGAWPGGCLVFAL